MTGDTATDQAHGLKGLSIDEDKSNAWSSKCFAYSRSQTLTCAPVISGSFVRLVYGLYSKAYSPSFLETRAHTDIVNELATLLSKIGSRGLHTLAPCSVPTSVFDLVPSFGVLALNSAYTGSGESVIDNLVKDLIQANSLLPQNQQCTIKIATVTLNIMTQRALHTSSDSDDSEGDSDSEQGRENNDEDDSSRNDCDDEEEEEEEEEQSYNEYGEPKGPEDVLIEADQLLCGPGGFIGVTIGDSASYFLLSFLTSCIIYSHR